MPGKSFDEKYGETSGGVFPPPDNAGASSAYLDVQAGALAKNVGGFLASGIKSSLGIVGGAIKNVFAPQPMSANRFPRGGAFYQVKDTDTSLHQVARSIGVNPSTVVEANYGIKTLPPAGTYIKARFDEEQNRSGIGGLPPDMRQSSPAAIAAQSAAQLRSDAGVTLDNFLTKRGYVPDNQLIKSGTQIPVDMWNAAGLGPLDAQALGGKLVGDSLVFGGAVGGGSGGGGPARDRKGNLVRNASQRGNRDERGGDAGALPDNASAVPVTVLSLRMGSG